MRLLFVMVALATLGSAVADEISEEDRTLLTALLAAQRQNESAFPRGEMTADVEHTHHQFRGTVKIGWEGDAYYSEADVVYMPLHNGVPVETPAQPKVVYESNQVHSLDYLGLRVDSMELKEPSAMHFAFRPRDFWHTMRPHVKRTWAETLEKQLQNDPKFRTEVLKLDADRVHVTRIFLTAGSDVTVYDFAQNGHVIEYHTLPSESSRFLYRSRYGWTKLDDERWVLKECVHEATAADDPEFEKAERLVFKVQSFSPDPVFPANRFTRKSLEALATQNASKKKPPGGAKGSLSESELNRSSQTLRDGNLQKPK